MQDESGFHGSIEQGSKERLAHMQILVMLLYLKGKGEKLKHGNYI
jgi:hypothetical protein